MTQLEQGGLVTFGATVGNKGNVRLLMPKSMKQNVTPDELEGYWVREFTKVTSQEECKAICSVADVRVPMPDQRLVPALFVHIEHVEGFAGDTLYPYGNGKNAGLVVGEPTIVGAESKVFTSGRKLP